MKQKPVKYAVEHIEFLDTYRKVGTSWPDLVMLFNDVYSPGFNNYNITMLQHAYNRYKYLLTKDSKELEKTNELDAIKGKFVANMQRTKVIKENKLIVDELLNQEQILNAMKLLVDSIKLNKPKIANVKIDKTKKNKTYMMVLSDLHNGARITKVNENNETIEVFNNKIFRARMRELARVFIIKIKQDMEFFNIEKIKIGMLGDFIQNAYMHGIESMVGCEYQNSEQVVECITSIFYDFILPIAQLGIIMEMECVDGNHDRPNEHKTYTDPGKTSLTWIIYNALKMLCDGSKLNTKWNIATNSFLHFNIYELVIGLEHGDLLKGGFAETAVKAHRAKRENQIMLKIAMFIFGHFHRPTMYGHGEFFINGSLCGQDQYAENSGYNTIAGQFILSFLDCKEKRSSFYDSFYVQLDHIKDDLTTDPKSAIIKKTGAK